MRNHIATSPLRLSAMEAAYEDGSGEQAGAPEAGPDINDIPQGYCAWEVLSGFATVGNALGAAAFMANAAATITNVPVTVANIFAATAAIIGSAAQTMETSPACKNFDNAATANRLGIGAIIAP